MTRRARTTLQRAAIFEAHGGTCHICNQKIDGTKERFELEHIVPYALTRDDSDDNLAPAHVSCHREKTRKDQGDIAKANRIRAKHMGAQAPARSPLPGSKGTKWKRKIGGGVVAREE